VANLNGVKTQEDPGRPRKTQEDPGIDKNELFHVK